LEGFLIRQKWLFLIMLLTPGKFYHIYNRGNNKETIFKEERNYAYFLALWKKHLTPVVDTYVYSLLPNHFHFLVRVKEVPEEEANAFSKQVSRSFANHFAAYAMAINKRYGREGSLFQKNFRRHEIDTDEYFEKIVLYIHTNARKHGLVGVFTEHPHHSFHSILSPLPTALMRDAVLNLFGSREEFIAAHDRYSSWLEDEIFLLEEMGDD
jgi:REP element-mobilizing transposase RayT